MKFVRCFSLLAAMFVLVEFEALGQDKKDAKDPPKFKGFLPTYWKQLGLTDQQKQDVYKIQGEYRSKIEELEAKIKELKAAEKRDLEKVLTELQKDQLRKIIAEKVPGGKDEKPAPKDEKKDEKPAPKDEKKP